MGLFDKLIGLKERNVFTNELLKITNEIIEKHNIDVKKITDIEMHISSFYLFGFANALRADKYKNITPTQMGKSMTNIISKVFLSSNTYSQDVIDTGIKSLQIKEKDDVKRSIIHKGMDAYLLWKNNKIDLLEDLINILTIVQKNF